MTLIGIVQWTGDNRSESLYLYTPCIGGVVNGCFNMVAFVILDLLPAVWEEDGEFSALGGLLINGFTLREGALRQKVANFNDCLLRLLIMAIL